MRQRLFPTCCLLLSILSLTGRAADPPPLPFWPAAPDVLLDSEKPSAETQRLVRDLASDDEPTRQHALGEIADKGYEAFPGLRQAALSCSDPKVQSRVLPLAPRPSFLPPPSFPQPLRKALAEYENEREHLTIAPPYYPSTSLNIVVYSADHWDLMLRFLDLHETDPKMSGLIKYLKESHPNFAAMHAVADNNLQRAEQILRGALSGKGAAPDYAAMIAMRKGSQFSPKAELDSLADLQLDELTRNYVAMHLFRAAGDLAGATPYARPFSDGLFPQSASILLENNDYAALPEPLSQGWRHSRTPRAYMPETLALRLSGRAAEADRLLAESAALQPKTKNFPTEWIFTLLMNERVDDALAFLRSRETNDLAFVILAHQLRLREALELHLDYSTKPAEFLLSVGLTQPARKIVLANPPQLEADPGFAPQNALHYAYLLRLVGATDEANRYEDIAWAWVRKQGIHYDAPQFLFPNYEQYSEFRFWVGNNPYNADQERFNRARDIMAGRVRPSVSEKDFPQFLTYCYSIFELQVAFNALTHVGQKPLAEKLVAAWCEKNFDPSGYAILGDWALEHDQPKVAVTYFLKAAVLNRTSASLMYRTGLALSRQSETRAAGDQLMRQAEFLVLGERNQAIPLARAIRRFESQEKGDAWFDTYDSHFGDPGWSSLNERIARARRAAEAKGDYQQALTLQTQALFRPDSLIPADGCLNIMANVTLYHRLRALEALARKDFPNLVDALDHNLNIGPPDIDLLERTLPSLHDSDPAAATRILKRAIDRLAPITEDYPEATIYMSQLTRLRTLKL